MNKSEIRKSIFHSSGCDADDWLEGARRSGYAFEGAKKALKKASQEVLSVALVIKKYLEEGKLDGMEASAVADYAILQVTRARDSLENGSQHYENRQLATQGEVAAYERVVKHFKSLHDREEAKIQSRLEAERDGELSIDSDGDMEKPAGRGQVTGVRPSAGLAAQRRAETASEQAPEAATEPDPTPEVKPAKAAKASKKTKKDKVG